jgi:hypothetical protein
MKIFGAILGAILAAVAIIAVVVSARNQIVKTERADKALDESTRRADAYLHMLKAAHGTPAKISRTPESIGRLPSATPAPVRNSGTVTITRPISVTVQYGSVSVSVGAKLQFVSRTGDKVRIRYYDGADYDIPISATDLK